MTRLLTVVAALLVAVCVWSAAATADLQDDRW